MNFNFLSPVSEAVATHIQNTALQNLGHKVKIHTAQDGIPDLNDVKIVILGIEETRNAINYSNEEINFESIRIEFYNLFPGNWHTTIADLGTIKPGDTVEDTYFAVKNIVAVLLEKNCIPIILGGSQDLTYASYRAFDNIKPMINIVNVDTNFDLGDANLPIKSNSYVGKIIVEEPYNLFNYSVIGYQTYFNSQEELDLVEKLYFEVYRLGKVSADISIVEPVMRDANIVSVDLKAIKASEVSYNTTHSPNGLSGKEICTIARYAGISNKVELFGIYEYFNLSKDTITAKLIAQMLWYFIEGVNCRVKDDEFVNQNNYQKFNVLIDHDELIFFKSIKTGRWWIEIPFLPNVNNKLKKHTLLPCTHSDYVQATKGKIPERWYKAYKKNSF